MKRIDRWAGVLCSVLIWCALAQCCFADGVLRAPTDSHNLITLSAVGDVMLARGVARQIELQGTDYPFAPTRSTLRASDITFGNLECAFSTQSPQTNNPVSLIANPSAAVALADAGFDVLSLANNHALDGGAVGWERTRSTLQGHRIGYCGAGSTLGEAETPVIIEKRGVRVAFVAFT